METSGNALTESEAAHAEFIKMAKIAVATALIRSKPVTMTGQQYATFLHQKIQSDRDEWEKKCKKLEQELLQLKVIILNQRESETGDLAENIPSCISATPPSSSEKVASEIPNMASKKFDSIVSHGEFLNAVSRLTFTAGLLDKAMESQVSNTEGFGPSCSQLRRTAVGIV